MATVSTYQAEPFGSSPHQSPPGVEVWAHYDTEEGHSLRSSLFPPLKFCKFQGTVYYLSSTQSEEDVRTMTTIVHAYYEKAVGK